MDMETQIFALTIIDNRYSNPAKKNPAEFQKQIFQDSMVFQAILNSDDCIISKYAYYLSSLPPL